MANRVFASAPGSQSPEYNIIIVICCNCLFVLVSSVLLLALATATTVAPRGHSYCMRASLLLQLCRLMSLRTSQLHNCFVKLLKLNISDIIEYNCPQCRHISIKNKDERFTKFVNKNKKCLKRVVQLFEDKLEQTNTRRLSNTWEAFSRRVNQETQPIIYYEYDYFIPNG